MNSESNPLAGNTAVVTGSSTGIGRAIALELATRGANVVVHGRSNSEKIQSLQKEIESKGVKSFALLADFSNEVDWDELISQAWKLTGQVNFWINNAGGDVLTTEWRDKPIEMKLEYLWKVDVVSSLMLSRRAGERMKQSQVATAETSTDPATSNTPIILNIGWDQAWQGMAGDSGELFATTKGAIMSMTKSLAQSLSPNVRVNCLAPGWIKTQWGEQASDYWDQRAANESLMNRWGTPQDIAKAAAFLCTEGASFISGQIIPLNGGFRYGDQAN